MSRIVGRKRAATGTISVRAQHRNRAAQRLELLVDLVVAALEPRSLRQRRVVAGECSEPLPKLPPLGIEHEHVGVQVGHRIPDGRAAAVGRHRRILAPWSRGEALPTAALALSLLGALGLLSGCTDASRAGWWKPHQQLSWYWQLQGRVNISRPVAAYDIDGFDTPPSQVAALQRGHKHVICYIDVGTWESWRPDAKRFPRSVLGAANGWPGERWLDIRRLAVLEPIVQARLEMCAKKGFDAVEPDNIDAWQNRTGFPITAAHQLTYDKWVAGEAHALGLAVFQKNDPDQARSLEPHFDGILDEQCNEFDQCALLAPYLAAHKPVLNAEYNLAPAQFCGADNAAGIIGARFSVQLDGGVYEPCWRARAPAVG